MHAQVALEVEAELGFTNVPGRTGVSTSDYVFTCFSQLAHDAPLWLPGDAGLGNTAFSFMSYDRLSPAQREMVVQHASAKLAALLAAASASAAPPRSRVLDTGGQGSPEWLRQRDGLLTGSQFGTALGMRGSAALSDFWEERVGLKPRWTGNRATAWGSATEPVALSAYRQLTGKEVDTSVALAVCPPDSPGEVPWMGASPDGLLRHEPGILEIKCPHGRFDAPGGPAAALPYPQLPIYYIPQALGLLHVFDRQFCDFFVYTQRSGCTLYHLPFDAPTWRPMRDALRQVWFENVLPARALLAREGPGAAEEARRAHAPRHDAARAAAFAEACSRLGRAARREDLASPPLQ